MSANNLPSWREVAHQLHRNRCRFPVRGMRECTERSGSPATAGPPLGSAIRAAVGPGRTPGCGLSAAVALGWVSPPRVRGEDLLAIGSSGVSRDGPAPQGRIPVGLDGDVVEGGHAPSSPPAAPRTPTSTARSPELLVTGCRCRCRIRRRHPPGRQGAALEPGPPPTGRGVCIRPPVRGEAPYVGGSVRVSTACRWVLRAGPSGGRTGGRARPAPFLAGGEAPKPPVAVGSPEDVSGPPGRRAEGEVRGRVAPAPWKDTPVLAGRPVGPGSWRARAPPPGRRGRARAEREVSTGPGLRRRQVEPRVLGEA